MQLGKNQFLFIPDQERVSVKILGMLIMLNQVVFMEASNCPQMVGELRFHRLQLLPLHPLVSREKIINGPRITSRIQIIKKALNDLIRFQGISIEWQ